MLGGEEVLVLVDCSFVGRNIALPFTMQMVVEVRIRRAVEDGVCLSRWKRYDLPLSLREVHVRRSGV